jgi:hypothetical protein
MSCERVQVRGSAGLQAVANIEQRDGFVHVARPWDDEGSDVRSSTAFVGVRRLAQIYTRRVE